MSEVKEENLSSDLIFGKSFLIIVISHFMLIKNPEEDRLNLITIDDR